MAATAAYLALVKVCTTLGGSYADVDLANEASAEYMRDLAETTNFKNTVGVSPDKERIYTLRDASFEISAHFNASDTNGQNIVRTAWLNGTALFIEFLPDGVNGFKCAVCVEKFSEKASVGGIADWSASLKKTGALTAVP